MSLRAALTFDDGPDPAGTPRVLDRLDELGLVATFFCLGHQVVAHPDVAREIVARGHEVATHGHRHESHLLHSPRWVGRDLEDALAAHAAAHLPRPQWYRPPYGHVSAATLWYARRAGLRVALWSVTGHEWAEPTGDAVATRVQAALHPGAIVLLHDTDVSNPAGSTDRVLEALGRLADVMRDRGWTATTLTRLVAE